MPGRCHESTQRPWSALTQFLKFGIALKMPKGTVEGLFKILERIDSPKSSLVNRLRTQSEDKIYKFIVETENVLDSPEALLQALEAFFPHASSHWSTHFPDKHLIDQVTRQRVTWQLLLQRSLTLMKWQKGKLAFNSTLRRP